MDTIDQDRKRNATSRIQDDRGCVLVKGVFQQGCWAGKAGQAGLGGVPGPPRSHDQAAAIVSKGPGLPQLLRKRTAERVGDHTEEGPPQAQKLQSVY